jgi:hypothetical protein
MSDKLGTMLVVGAVRFHAGVKVATAQGAIDRLAERHRKLDDLMRQVQEFEHRLPPTLSAKIKSFYTSGA